MVVHPVKSLIALFEDMFPQFKDDNNLYYGHGVNGLKVKHPKYPVMVFRYENKSKWEIITLEKDESQVEALRELRAQLDIAQKQLNNLRRRKEKKNVKE